MKRLFTLLAFLIYLPSLLQAQTTKLVGYGSQIYSNSPGTIFSINDDGTNPEKWMNFKRSGSPGSLNLIESNGKFFGITEYGGSEGYGVVFSLDNDGSNYMVLHDFDSQSGNPKGSLVENNGKLWGVAFSYNDNTNGEIFSINLDGSEYSRIHEFETAEEGLAPVGGLVVVGDKFWGMTRRGGTDGFGVIFNLDLEGDNYTKVHGFDEANGYYPNGRVCYSNDKIWGMTVNGGTADSGVLFSLDLDGTNFIKHHDFEYTTGAYPAGSLVAIGGKLWGTTWFGGPNDGGGVFNLDLDGTNYSAVVNFGDSNGAYPKGDLIESNGKIWGTSSDGYNYGTIFNLDLDGTNFQLVRGIWPNSNGDAPKGGLLESGGKLWGVTDRGGIGYVGVIFNLNLADNIYTKVYDFESIGGTKPKGSLIQSHDLLWGVTEQGGTNGDGVIFHMNRDGSGYEEIYQFEHATGYNATGSLIENEGKLWGTVRLGGPNGDGGVFRVDMDGTNYAMMHAFDSPNEEYYRGSLTVANDKIWGLIGSGANVFGYLFNMNLDGTDYAIVHSFDETNGSYPEGKLVESNGKLWGMTHRGGVHGEGVIFNLSLDGSNYTKIHEFDGNDGARVHDNYLVECQGKLWGVTNEGNNGGVIFNLDTTGANYNKVHDFDFSLEFSPQGGLVESNNKLWGIAGSGGSNGYGAIFSIEVVGHIYTKVHDLGPETLGRAIHRSSLLVVTDEQTIDFSLEGKSYGEESFTLESTANSNNEISYSSSDPSIISISGDIATVSGAGEVILTASQAADDWYYPGTTTQTIQVSKAELSVTADDQSVIYGGSPSYSYQLEGFVNGEDASLVDVVPSGMSTLDPTPSVGEHAILVNQDGSDNNYGFNYIEGNLTVEKANLTAIADNQSRIYGGENPELSVSYTGFVNGDSETDLDTAPVSSTLADATSSVGVYEIAITEGIDNNYEITASTAGSLSIEKALLTIMADDQNIYIGDEIPELSLSFSGFVNGESEEDVDLPEISTNATQSSEIGEYDITLTGGGSLNYDIVLVEGILTIEAVLSSSASLTEELMVYPNPVSGYFKLPAASPIVNITIFNLNGRVVKQFDNHQASYDISDLPNGAYVLTINRDGEMKTVRIIKE